MNISIEVKQVILNGVAEEKQYDITVTRHYGGGVLLRRTQSDMIYNLTEDECKQLCKELPERLEEALKIA